MSEQAVQNINHTLYANTHRFDRLLALGPAGQNCMALLHEVQWSVV